MAERLLAEFEDEHATVAALGRLHDAGFRELEVYMPFPSIEVERALARPRSRLPLTIFLFGIAGAAGAYFLQWFLVGFLYPLDVGGRPPHFPLAFVIITFEMTVLAASLTAFVGTLVKGRLVRLTDDVQNTPGFESVTRDRFWIELVLDTPAHDPDRTRALLTACGALRIEEPEVAS
jgi:hypothetical protein